MPDRKLHELIYTIDETLQSSGWEIASKFCNKSGKCYDLALILDKRKELILALLNVIECHSST